MSVPPHSQNWTSHEIQWVVIFGIQRPAEKVAEMFNSRFPKPGGPMMTPMEVSRILHNNQANSASSGSTPVTHASAPGAEQSGYTAPASQFILPRPKAQQSNVSPVTSGITSGSQQAGSSAPRSQLILPRQHPQQSNDSPVTRGIASGVQQVRYRPLAPRPVLPQRQEPSVLTRNQPTLGSSTESQRTAEPARNFDSSSNSSRIEQSSYSYPPIRNIGRNNPQRQTMNQGQPQSQPGQAQSQPGHPQSSPDQPQFQPGPPQLQPGQPQSQQGQPQLQPQPAVINWIMAKHEGCDIDGPHHHDDDGGISFPSTQSFLDLAAKMYGPAMTLDSIADMMENIQRQDEEQFQATAIATAEALAAREYHNAPAHSGYGQYHPGPSAPGAYDSPYPQLGYDLYQPQPSASSGSTNSFNTSSDTSNYSYPQDGAFGQSGHPVTGGYHAGGMPSGPQFDTAGYGQRHGYGHLNPAAPQFRTAASMSAQHGSSAVPGAAGSSGYHGTAGYAGATGSSFEPSSAGSMDVQMHGSSDGHSGPVDSSGNHPSV